MSKSIPFFHTKVVILLAVAIFLFGGITVKAATVQDSATVNLESLIKQINDLTALIAQLQGVQTGTTPTTGGINLSSPKLGDTVIAIQDVNVRNSFGLSGTLVGTQLLRSTGVVIGSNPQTASGFTWVQVNFATGADGWAVTHRLKVTGSSVVTIVDTDRDTVADAIDNCKLVSNTDQLDTDRDGVGNVCDTTPSGTPVPSPTADTDGDGVVDVKDNCPKVRNAGQWDKDKDGIGNVCDTDYRPLPTGTTTPPIGTVPKDTDGDKVADTVDNCPAISNATQTDTDKDGLGNVCDSTPNGTPTPTPTPGGGGTVGSGSISGIKSNPKVLFVGNSYTTAAVSRERADSASGIFMRMLQRNSAGASSAYGVIGGSVMSELWNWAGKPAAMDPKNLLRTGDYDLVVLQSGDGLLTSGSQADYEKYTDLFATLAKENGTDVMLYGIWAPDNMISISKGETVASNAHTFYTATAKRNTAGYAASGMAYTEAYKKFTELYGNGDDGQTAENMLTSDFVHPNPPAAYLAANMLYLGAFGVNPPTPSEFLPTGVSLSDAKILQTIAITAHKAHSIGVPNAWYK